jgi:small subunit ribosomal protein S5e
MAEEAPKTLAAANPDMFQNPVEPKLFGRWDMDKLLCAEISLVDYIKNTPARFSTSSGIYVPHTAGRYQVKRFRKALCPIVERMACSLMMHGRNNGKKLKAVRIIRQALDIVALLNPDANPVQVLIDAVKNGGPREDSTRVGSAGTVRRQAVDVSPIRRVNQAIQLITTGARLAAFRNIKSISECLADEISNCAKESSNSYAIKKKDEIERVAKANR